MKYYVRYDGMCYVVHTDDSYRLYVNKHWQIGRRDVTFTVRKTRDKFKEISIKYLKLHGVPEYKKP